MTVSPKQRETADLYLLPTECKCICNYSRGVLCKHRWHEINLWQQSFVWGQTWVEWTHLADLDHTHASGMRAVWRRPGPELWLDWPCGPQGWRQLESVAVGKQQALIEVKEQFCLYLSPSFSLPVLSLFLTLQPPRCDATFHSASEVSYFQLLS